MKPGAVETVAELLAGVDRREPFVNPDGRSASAFERVWIEGQAHIVKYLHLDDDFTMRASGDLGCRAVRAWEMGLLDAAPGLIDHATVGAAHGHGRNGWGGALLMRDVCSELASVGDAVLPGDQHDAFVDHLAGWCAATWGFSDGGRGLLAYEARWGFFGQAALEAEGRLGWPERVPRVAAQGWEEFSRRAPAQVAEAVEQLRRDVGPLADALALTPSCLLHGDPKASNMGTAADGRTVLIDWAYVGQGPACHELGWYLALNRAKLPTTKEATIDAFSARLGAHGVDTTGWWDRQLGLALLGTLVQFGWEKALGSEDELGWWCDAARTGLCFL
ncbi:MAG: phosphotransferase family protein [Acidimicrobiales bacterium]